MSTEIVFKPSKSCSLGVEIELQIINPYTFQLIEKSIEILDSVHHHDYPGAIKPEITQNMIEINTSIHDNMQTLSAELQEIKNYFVNKARELGIRFSGGGTHSLHRWEDNKIFPESRYRRISKVYDYVAKMYTIFGQHVHIGCESGDDAIYLTHALNRYIPHFIALSASSPFFQGIDTTYHSTRLNTVSTLPTHGCIPFINSWKAFNIYFSKMRCYKIVETMKDFYWDVRPKPEFGTVELRVCDTPLTIETSVMLAAYAQTLAHYILKEKKFKMNEESYMLYNYNRFQAARFGFSGLYIDPHTGRSKKIGDDILDTIAEMQPHTHLLENSHYIATAAHNAEKQYNDSQWIRKTYKKLNSFPKLIHEQSKLWMGD